MRVCKPYFCSEHYCICDFMISGPRGRHPTARRHLQETWRHANPFIGWQCRHYADEQQWIQRSPSCRSSRKPKVRWWKSRLFQQEGYTEREPVWRSISLRDIDNIGWFLSGRSTCLLLGKKRIKKNMLFTRVPWDRHFLNRFLGWWVERTGITFFGHL